MIPANPSDNKKPRTFSGDYTFLRFNKKIEALLANPDFVLLYVPPDRGTMKLVRPAADLELRNTLRKRSDRTLHYFALSHLWGMPDKKDLKNHLWDVGDFIRDENGDPVAPIPMRQEKRDTLLALLRTSPSSCEHQNCSYWWIDVLCARVTTPLGIMGPIYTHCKRCYAMVDIEPRVMRVLCCEHIRTKIRTEYRLMYNEEDKDRQLLRYRSFVEKWPDVLYCVKDLAQAKWFNRVWTYQEATLSRFAFLIPETSGNEAIEYKRTVNWFAWATTLGDIEDPGITDPLLKDTTQAMKIITNKCRDVYGAYVYCDLFTYERQPSAFMFIDVIRTSLGISNRTCMHSVDYVYGVLGLLHMDLDRMEDPETVWKNFLVELDKLIQVLDYRWIMNGRRVKSISITDKAYTVDLSRAQKLSDVYDGIIDVTYENVPV